MEKVLPVLRDPKKELQDAWMQVSDLYGRFATRRVEARRDEDSVLRAMGWIMMHGSYESDPAIGEARFSALGDDISVELYDPRRMTKISNTLALPNGMPMQGELSINRNFESSRSAFNIGPDGELYKTNATAKGIDIKLVDPQTKIAVLDYVDIRALAIAPLSK